MSVDLADSIDALKRSVNPPGEDLFPDTQDDEWLGRLQDAFWDARLDGLLNGYIVDDDGLITPIAGSVELTRDLVQIVVFYATANAIYAKLLNIKTLFSAKAGPVSFETQQSANVLRDLAQSLRDRKAILLTRLGDLQTTQTYYIDSVFARTENLVSGLDTFLGAGVDFRARGNSGQGFA